MSKVNNRMREKKEEPYQSTIFLKFFDECENYDTIIIVEGSSDESFYENTNIDIFNNKSNNFYIYAVPNKKELDNKRKKTVGKEAVIKSYFDIKKMSWRKIYNCSVIFIVDKDFFGIDWKAPAYNNFIKDERATNEDINNFTILDCHSHECYFILENNLKQIFKLLNIEDKLENFNKILKENLDDFSEYFAYKSILEDENPKLSYVGYKYDNIGNIEGINFNFEIKDSKLKFNRDDMLKGIEKMKKTIEKSHNRKNLENQYLEMKQKFKNHPELLRGHTVYELLECYLNSYGKTLKIYNKYNSEIIKKMEVPLDIKILKHSMGKYKLEKKE